MKKPGLYSCAIALFLLLAITGVYAQNAASPTTDSTPQTDEEKQKEKEALEKKAGALLEQIIGEVQMLRLPENRIRVQIVAGDLLWKRNEARARSMFSIAAEGLAEVIRNNDGNSRRSAGQLRQELVMSAALHDATLAYDLLAATRSAPVGDTDPNARRANNDAMIEQGLLTQIARIDPKFAAQKAEEALSQNQFPITLGRVLAELQTRDKETFLKLSDKVVSRLLSANMLSNADAGTLALSLLQAGPRLPDKASDPSALPAVTSNRIPVVSATSFVDLLNAVIDSAMKFTPPTATQRQGNGRNPGGGRGRAPVVIGNADSQPGDAQVEQNNAGRLLAGLQQLLPQVDQYLPNRAVALRQKITETGGNNNTRQSYAQFGTLMQQGTTDSILQAAPIAPPQLQPRLYQQAAMKALDEGNADRARQIANDHLDARTRDSVLQKVEFQVMASKVEADNMDQLRHTLAQLHSDEERVDLLLRIVATSPSQDQKLATRLLGEAQRLTNRRATGYRQFEQQLAIADAFSAIDPVRSFEVLDPGIAQLNELLSAAAVLSGFELNIFKDGEMPMEPNSSLTNMVGRFGQELASLASKDFERAEMTANKFQLAEPRLMVRLGIVRSILSGPSTAAINGGIGGRGFVRRPN